MHACVHKYYISLDSRPRIMSCIISYSYYIGPTFTDLYSCIQTYIYILHQLHNYIQVFFHEVLNLLYQCLVRNVKVPSKNNIIILIIGNHAGNFLCRSFSTHASYSPYHAPINICLQLCHYSCTVLYYNNATTCAHNPFSYN